MTKKDIKQFFKHFKVPFILTGIVLVLYLLFFFTGMFGEGVIYYDSPNTERVYGNKRVFDFGDQLTDDEEIRLEEYIREAEKKTCTDIVVVTLNESLKEFSEAYSLKYNYPSVAPEYYVMEYADEFWEVNRFGYDAAQVLDGTTNTGDGVLLLDNVFREPETGKIYTWMCTTGVVEEKFSEGMIDRCLDEFYSGLDYYSYFEACEMFINTYVNYMVPKDYSKVIWPYVVTLIFVIIYVCVNRESKAGLVTTTESTYLINGSVEFVEKRDTFTHKNVSKRYNPPSSSSSGGGGGGGHHSSGGGGSHGGGGHSR